MNWVPRFRLAICAQLVAQSAAIFGCAQSNNPQGHVVAEQAYRLEAPSDLLARTDDIVSAPNGDLYVVDSRTSTIWVLDSLGSYLRSIGSEGTGPGELKYPDSPMLRGDTLFVANRPNGRLERFSLDGRYLGGMLLPPEALNGRCAYLPEGVFLASTNGEKGALAVLSSTDKQLQHSLGTPTTSPRTTWDLTQMKAEIAQGHVPPELHNQIVPVLNPDTTAWVVVPAVGSILRFGADGTLRWETRVDPRMMAAARQEFFKSNRAEKRPTHIHALTPFKAARGVGGSLWLLMNQPSNQPTRFLVIHNEGQRFVRLEAPGVYDATAFAVDPVRRMLLLVTAEPAALFRLRVPGDAF